MKSKEPKTKVIFRVFTGKACKGEVIALFPEVAVNGNFGNCQSYMHVGQHGAASVDLGRTTRLATPKEYASLKKELEKSIGYNLEIRNRISPQMNEIRRAEISAMTALTA